MNLEKDVLFLSLCHPQYESISTTFPPQLVYMPEPVLNPAALFSIPSVIAPVPPICFTTRFILLLVFLFSYSNDEGTVGQFFDTEL